MQNSITKTATSNDVQQELAVSRALSALCGGSGVGQAPEPPQRAALRQAQGKIREVGEFLPKAPQSLQGSIHIPHVYEIGEKVQIELETKIGEKLGEVKKVAEPRREVGKLKEIKGKLGEFNGKVRGVFQTPPRVALRFALQTASYACILIAFVGFCFAYGPVIKAEADYQLKILSNTNKNNTEKVKKVKVLPKTNAEEFAGINFPADTSIVIPKIDAAAEIIPNVDASNYSEYMAALQKGVAHAKGTALPGMAGNSYLFAHSAGNLFDIARFNAVFYLIGKLEKGDAIYVKFGNEKFKYTVVDKKEVDPADVQFLTGNLAGIEGGGGIEGVGAGDRTLTLQTCVPPGTDWRRLLVFAKIQKT